jgi:four helix bundle protein
MSDSIVAQKSFRLALRIVKLYQYLCDEKKEYVLSKQLLRSGTSIGANVREALHGQSKRDFLSKIGIALKEANETQYWLELLSASEYIGKTQSESLWADCDEVIRLLVSITKTTKKNLGAENGK